VTPLAAGAPAQAPIDLRAANLETLAHVYQDLHSHPELAMEEQRTSAIAAGHLRGAGYEVHTGIGVTGVVGLLRRGEGPMVMLRADMDGLPVLEETGLPYASTQVIQRDDGELPTMHACGHDMHVAAMIGAAQELAVDSSWTGTLMVVFQPAEETGEGARAMLADGLFERFGRPGVVLGQHVTPLPAGYLGAHKGPAFAAADSIQMNIFGRGGHGSQPERTVDPILLAASIILRLHTLVAREVSAFETAVLTVGEIQSGSAPNIVPDTAEIRMSLRTYNPVVREQLLAAIERVAAGEAKAAGAPRLPELEFLQSFPVLINDPSATARTNQALQQLAGVQVIDPGALTSSEDIGEFAAAAGAPAVYWLLGGADPALSDGVQDAAALERIMANQPSNHSPHYAPVIDPTLAIGVAALVVAAKEWLGEV